MASFRHSSTDFGETFQDIFKKVLDSLASTGADDTPDFATIYTTGEPIIKNLKGFMNCGGFGAADVYDIGKAIVVYVDLPGVVKNDISLNVAKNGIDHVLQVSVERKSPVSLSGTIKTDERFAGRKNKEVRLQTVIDPNAVSAKYENGVLIVTIQKLHQENSSKSIPIL
jgi:HSP20 family protein